MIIISPVFRKRFRLVLACVLIVLGAAACVHAVRATRAQRLYLETKFGLFRDWPSGSRPITDSEAVAIRAHRAYSLYPENYYFPIYAAQHALQDALQATHSGDFDAHVSRAAFFSRQAMAINPYAPEARMIHAAILAEDNRLPEAIAYWRDQVVDREFWDRGNHDFMVRLYLRSSRPEDLQAAIDSLPFVGDRGLREELRQFKRAAGQ